ncbi:MAG TPA: hypothetical protein VLL52_19845 [Anaerolineae bacterium]|nr:hypothetical protein [Anaerolineae bacterium]
MTQTNFHLLGHWRLPANIHDIFPLLHDPLSWPQWGPAFCRHAAPLATPHHDYITTGNQYQLRLQGLWPYPSQWQFTLSEYHPPHRLAFTTANHYFHGPFILSLHQNGPDIDIYHDWLLKPRLPLLDTLTARLPQPLRLNQQWLEASAPLFAPFLRFNYRWAFERAAHSLQLAASAHSAARALTNNTTPNNKPPAPTSTYPLWLAGASATIVGSYFWLKYRHWRRWRQQ